MTDTLSPERVAEIRALAEKATPGPWIRAGVRHKIGQESCFAVGPDVNPIAFLPIGSQQRDRFHAEAFKDAAYIAALDPQTVLALLASHEALRAEVERLREENAVARNTNGSQQNELIGLYDQLTTACTEAARRMRERCAAAICIGCRDSHELIVHRAMSGRVTGYTHKWIDRGVEMTSGCQAGELHNLPLEES